MDTIVHCAYLRCGDDMFVLQPDGEGEMLHTWVREQASKATPMKKMRTSSCANESMGDSVPLVSTMLRTPAL